MTALPAAGHFVAGGTTNATAKTAQDDMTEVEREGVGGAAQTELTIASGSVTPTGAEHSIDTESDDATDDLANILQTNLFDGRHLLIRHDTGGRDVTVKHAAGGAGQILLKNNVDYLLDDVEKHLLLRREGTTWVEVFRSHEAVFTSALQSLTINVTTTLAHLLGVAPRNVQFVLECTIADLNYSVGDRVYVDSHMVVSAGMTTLVDATNVTVIAEDTQIVFNVNDKSTRASTAITKGSWNWQILAQP